MTRSVARSLCDSWATCEKLWGTSKVVDELWLWTDWQMLSFTSWDRIFQSIPVQKGTWLNQPCRSRQLSGSIGHLQRESYSSTIWTTMLWIYTVFPKKQVTTFSMIRWSRTICLLFTKIFGTLITKSIGHRQVYLVSHLTYFMQLLYLGKLLRPKYHEFSLKLLIFSMLQY